MNRIQRMRIVIAEKGSDDYAVARFVLTGDGEMIARSKFGETMDTPVKTTPYKLFHSMVLTSQKRLDGIAKSMNIEQVRFVKLFEGTETPSQKERKAISKWSGHMIPQKEWAGNHVTV